MICKTTNSTIQNIEEHLATGRNVDVHFISKMFIYVCVSFSDVLSANMEEAGLITYTAARH